MEKLQRNLLRLAAAVDFHNLPPEQQQDPAVLLPLLLTATGALDTTDEELCRLLSMDGAVFAFCFKLAC